MLACLPPPGGRNKPAILSAAMCLIYFVLVVSELRCVFVSALPTDGECTSSVHYPPALLRSYVVDLRVELVAIASLPVCRSAGVDIYTSTPACFRQIC